MIMNNHFYLSHCGLQWHEDKPQFIPTSSHIDTTPLLSVGNALSTCTLIALLNLHSYRLSMEYKNGSYLLSSNWSNFG